jgi:uncharacterized membrane protein
LIDIAGWMPAIGKAAMKTALTVIGFLLLAMGLLWMGQGAGIIRWPAKSFMISQSQWIYYGGATALVGLVIAVIGARR